VAQVRAPVLGVNLGYTRVRLSYAPVERRGRSRNMAFISKVKTRLRLAPERAQASLQTTAKLRGQTEAFCGAATLLSQTSSFIELASGIWLQPSDRIFASDLICWVSMLEEDSDLRFRFQRAWKAMLDSLDSVSLFAEAGLPGQHTLLPEVTRRIFQRMLPPPRGNADITRLFSAIFASPRSRTYVRTSIKHFGYWPRESSRGARALPYASAAPA
jgi:hypothetical protein